MLATVEDSQKEACAVLVMKTMLVDLSEKTGEKFDVLLLKFSKSRTYKNLFDYDTKYWCEGPDYLYTAYKLMN